MVTIGSDLDLVAQRPAGRAADRLTAQDATFYLRPSEGLIQVTPLIGDLARKIAGARAPEAAVDAFVVYMRSRFLRSYVRYDEVAMDTPGDWAVNRGFYDCQLGAAFLISLCRARGIPARMVNGHFLHRLAPSNNSWVEISIDGVRWGTIDLVNRERGLPSSPTGSDWWTHFARRTEDYRLVLERMPLAFTGPMSVRRPPVWQMLHAKGGRGLDITYRDIADGRLIYRDHIAVERVG